MVTTHAIAPTSSEKITAQEMHSLVQQGSMSLEDGDLAGALQAFEKVVAAFPDRPEGHNNLGALYNSLGEFAKAESCFDQVIQILPDNPGLYYNRGMARSSQEKFDTAREDFEYVLKTTPHDTDCLNNLGVMDFMQGKFSDARSRFQQALDIRPDYVRALLNLCDVDLAEDKGSVAVERCETYLRTRNSSEVRRALLEMLSTGCREALEKAGRTAETLLNTGDQDPEITRKLDRIQKAKAVLEEMPGI